MRQVGRDELIWGIKYQLGRLPESLRKQLISRERDKRNQAEDIIATIIVDKRLTPYEVLTDAPEGPPFPSGRGITGYFN